MEEEEMVEEEMVADIDFLYLPVTILPPYAV